MTGGIITLTGTRFAAETTVADALKVHPRARDVFTEFQLNNCTHCELGARESLEEICTGHGVGLNDFLDALNALPAQSA